MDPTEEALEDFKEEMAMVLEKHREKKGDSWQTCDIEFLEGKLQEEVLEYFEEGMPFKKAKEVVDIANIAMMLWVRQRKVVHDNAMARKAKRGEEDD